MAALRQMELWRQLREPRAALFLVALAFCLVRARDQPGIDVHLGGTTATVVPADVLLGALLLALAFTVRGRLTRQQWFILVVAAGFCAVILVSAAANSAAALVSGVKLVELSTLALGAVVVVRTRGELEAVVDVLLLFTIAADAYGLVKFVTDAGGRQSSFLGEHDFAALATLPLVYGLALLFEPQPRRGRATLAICSGAVGCVLGAALASLVGLYLGALVLVVVAARRRALSVRPTAIVVIVVTVVTAGTLVLRAGDLGFLQSWFGQPAEKPGQYAASWSQRLIYAYVGGRVFLAHPVLGTGWWGELPPREFTGFLPDARDRFSDQPPRYFPPRNRSFIPQQTFDQVLYELGIVGGALLVTLFGGLVGACVRAARRARDAVAYLPAVWLAGTVGALAGEGLFGGAVLATTFWLVVGLVAASPSIAEASR